jgi:hypothetical protein
MASKRWAFAAAVWALLFALPSFYWARGGERGQRTIAAHPEDIALINEPAIVFLTGVAKILAGLLVFALARNWGTAKLRRWLRLLALTGGGFMLLYGAALLVQHALMVAGAVGTPDTLGEPASRWHLGLWDPVWIAGGILFLATGLGARRESPRGVA